MHSRSSRPAPLEVLLQHRYWRPRLTISFLPMLCIRDEHPGIYMHVRVLILRARDQSMMPMGAEECTVAPLSILQELGNSGHGRRAGPRIDRDLPIRDPLCQLLGHFQPLAPSLELAQCSDVPEKIGRFLLRAAGEQCSTEGPKPGFPAKAVVGETPFHSDQNIQDERRCANDVLHSCRWSSGFATLSSLIRTHFLSSYHSDASPSIWR